MAAIKIEIPPMIIINMSLYGANDDDIKLPPPVIVDNTITGI
jgi:hypothetical protein